MWAASLNEGLVLLRNLLAVIEHHALCFHPGMGCEVGRVVRIQQVFSQVRTGITAPLFFMATIGTFNRSFQLS